MSLVGVCASDAKTKMGKADRRGEGAGPGLALHLLTAAVRLRVAQPDCYAGTVFLIKPSAYCPSISDVAIAVARALDQEDLVIVTIKVSASLYAVRRASPESQCCGVSSAPTDVLFHFQ